MKKEDKDFLKQVEKLVYEQMKQKHVNCDTVCESLGITNQSLRRRIFTITGRTGGKYLLTIRMKYAKELIEKGEATITTLNLTTDVTYTVAGETETVYHRLAAANIPMVTATPTFNHWSGGVVTDYLWLSGDSSMKLYDGPTNIMNVWITFKNGIKAQARIAG